jgi:PAS domain S-box-containing protein
MQDEELLMFQTAENALNNGRSIGVESETGMVFQLADSTIESCDLVAERLLGYSAKQLVGTTSFEPVWQAIYPDGSHVAPKDYPAIVALRSGKPCRNVVMGFYKPSGDLVWLRLNSTPLFQGDTTTSYAVVTTFSEVLSSQQNEPQLEATLRSSEQRFRDMANNAPMMVWVTDPTGYCTYLSRSWYDFSGQTEEAGLGFGWLDVIHPDDRESSKTIFLTANASQEAFQLEYRLRRFDGEYRTCIDAGRPWKSADGDFKGYIGSVIDIEDRKLAESALRRSEERYRTLFESIDEGFCVIEVLFDENDTPLDYRFLEINPVFEQQTGLRQAVGKTARQLLPDIEDHWIKIYGQVALTGESVRFENGSEAMNRWFDVYACRTGQPEERKVAIVFKDISDRVSHEAERERSSAILRQSEEQSRNILESINDAFFAVDENWRFTYVNQIAYTLLDRKPGDLIGKIFWSEFPGVNDSEFEQLHRRAMSDRVAGSVTAFYPDHQRWYEVHSYPAAKGVTMYFRNVTDQIQAQAALQQTTAELERQLQKFNAVMSSVPDFIYMFDLSGRFIDVNKPLLDLWQKTSAEAIGKNFFELDYPVDLAVKLHLQIQEVIQTRQPLKDEMPFTTSAFGTRAYEYIFVPIFDANGAVEMVAGVTRDITDRKKLLQREQAAREAAETANRIKDEFLAVLSHELRSPLNPILGWSKLLQQGKLDAAKTKTALATIERNAQLQSQLIEDLLDISRILRGKLSLNVMPVELSKVILAALETVRLAAEAKSLQIQTTFSPDVVTVIGDAGRLQQVVWNLLSNAVKFTFQGGQITVTLTQTGTDAQLQVTDTGKGINADFLPYVFEHFRQEDGATTRKFGGLGLGLAIARQIAELHGGRIWVESPGEDRGATFTVQIPLAPRFSELPSTEQSSVSTSDLSGIHILVVDDDADSRDFITFVLEQAGAIVTPVASGIEALQAIEQSVFDLVVSDIGMPEMDGYALIQQIRALKPKRQIPAIALTAYAGEIDQQQAIAAGFQAHIAKPVDPNAAIAIVVQFTKRANAKERSPDS